MLGPAATWRVARRSRASTAGAKDRGERVAVHAFSNFRAEFDEDGTATANWYMLLWGADGEPRAKAAPHADQPRHREIPLG
jgi:hypothetical protein